MLMYYVLHSTYFKLYLCYVINSKTIKKNKMKTALSNNRGAALEIANQIVYSLKVLVIGLFIPFSFVFGITYKRHNDVASKTININKSALNTSNNNTVDLPKMIPGRNS